MVTPSQTYTQSAFYLTFFVFDLLLCSAHTESSPLLSVQSTNRKKT